MGTADAPGLAAIFFKDTCAANVFLWPLLSMTTNYIRQAKMPRLYLYSRAFFQFGWKPELPCSFIFGKWCFRQVRGCALVAAANKKNLFVWRVEFK